MTKIRQKLAKVYIHSQDNGNDLGSSIIWLRSDTMLISKLWIMELAIK